MAKAGIVVLADTETHGDLGRISNRAPKERTRWARETT